MPHSYLGVTSFKSAITIAGSDTADDARLRAVLEAVSQQIDDECGRTFRVHRATVYPRVSGGRLLLDADVLAVTSLKTDTGGDRTYATTWTATDYDLEPSDAPARHAPYWEILTAPAGAYGFPGSRRGVELVAKLGYWEDLLAVGALAEDLDASETGVDLAAGHGLEVLQTILVDAEQMYITGFTSTNTATVERGVNGTTAAVHTTLAAVSVYRYPGPIVEAVRIQAARIFQRVHAPFGVTGSAEMGTMAVISRIDPDVKMLVQPYRHLVVA